jgi:hypothetical protein
MRKSPLVALITLSLIGATYALVSGLYPDTTEFPRVPVSDGTIGSALSKITGTTDLANYAGTGVMNTATLTGNITANKLLKTTNCGPSDGEWTGIDPTGKVICGNTPFLLATIGTVEKRSGVGLITVYRADGNT